MTAEAITKLRLPIVSARAPEELQKHDNAAHAELEWRIARVLDRNPRIGS